MTTSVGLTSCLSAHLVSSLWTRIATGLLKGAGNAVVRTPYSRAHRIGLNGSSCFLRGLCEDLSSPTQGFARVQIDRRAMRNLLFLVHLLDRQGDREGDAYGDLGLSCTLHLPALQVAIEALLK